MKVHRDHGPGGKTVVIVKEEEDRGNKEAGGEGHGDSRKQRLLMERNSGGDGSNWCPGDRRDYFVLSLQGGRRMRKGGQFGEAGR